MSYEVEQKYRVRQMVALRTRLEAMGAEFHPGKDQVDRYFAHPSRDFAATDEAFRLRRDGTVNRITYKGPRLDTATKTRREIELSLPVGQDYLEEFSQLLRALGFQSVTEVKKHRTSCDIAWRERVVEVSLDEVTDVGSFVELELVSDEGQIEEAQQIIGSLAAELDLDETVRRSYLELLLESRAARDS
jgi:adenylate cyclase class 2